MLAEFQTSFNRRKVFPQLLWHIQQAEQHGCDAAANTYMAMHNTPKSKTRMNFLLLRIRLHIAIVRGRTAEINERMRVPSHVIKGQKDEAIGEVFGAMEGIRDAVGVGVGDGENECLAWTWTKRLRKEQMAARANPIVMHHESEHAEDTRGSCTCGSYSESLPAYSDLSLVGIGIALAPYQGM